MQELKLFWSFFSLIMEQINQIIFYLKVAIEKLTICLIFKRQLNAIVKNIFQIKVCKHSSEAWANGEQKKMHDVKIVFALIQLVRVFYGCQISINRTRSAIVSNSFDSYCFSCRKRKFNLTKWENCIGVIFT